MSHMAKPRKPVLIYAVNVNASTLMMASVKSGYIKTPQPFVGLYPVSQNSGPLKLNLFQHRCHHSSLKRFQLGDQAISHQRHMFHLRMHPN